ncbi:MAG: NosD domain-containing protein [Promethearchaeia archaeon]
MKNYSKNKQFRKNSLLVVLSLSCFILCFSLWNQSAVISPVAEADNAQIPNNFEGKLSGDYSGLAEVYIKNNWTDTSDTYSWCTGSGTEEDPYVIDGLIIDAENVNVCLVIQDTEDHFIVRNSRFNGSIDNSDGGGLVLNNVTNGNITKNRIYDNYYGIWLNYTSDTWIEDNKIYDNQNDGIILQKSTNNYIFDNLIKNSTKNGISLVDSDHNNMSFNIIHINTLYGVHLGPGSDYNGLHENYLGYNVKGCYKDEGTDNIFDLNDCIGNYEEEPVYGDYEPTDLTPFIVAVVIILGVIAGLVIFAKFGFPLLKEKYLNRPSRESAEQKIEKQV